MANNRLLLNATSQTDGDLQYDAAGYLVQTLYHAMWYTTEGYLHAIRQHNNVDTGSYLYNGLGERTVAVRNDTVLRMTASQRGATPQGKLF